MASKNLTPLRLCVFAVNFFTSRTLKLLSLAIIILVLYSSCEKQINLNLSTGPATLVVEAEIETNLPPFVVLTNSMGFFSSIDFSTLQNSFVHKDKATVTVSDGTKTITLKEYAIDTGNNSKFYIYSVDTTGGINPNNVMIGQVNKFYTLTINYNGQTYTSVTKIPTPKPVDSMWYAPNTSTNPKVPTDAMLLYANYSDPDTPGNYVRYFTKRNHEPFYGADNVFTDEVINGNKVSSIRLALGNNNAPNPNNNFDSSRYLFPGDTIILKWCMIDRGVYDFWNTYAFAQQAVGNPFSSPINVKSNISNGALGVWAGYGSSFDTLIIK